MTLLEVPLFGFICAVAWVIVCYCVVPKYVRLVIKYVPLTVGSSPFLCSCVVYRSVYVEYCSVYGLHR
jgi:hypothetical protein